MPAGKADLGKFGRTAIAIDQEYPVRVLESLGHGHLAEVVTTLVLALETPYRLTLGSWSRPGEHSLPTCAIFQAAVVADAFSSTSIRVSADPSETSSLNPAGESVLLLARCSGVVPVVSSTGSSVEVSDPSL